MENIIEKIYNLHLQSNDFAFATTDKQTMDEEWKLYHYLYENLPQDYQSAFLNYVKLRSERQRKETKASYEYGFKTAMRLFYESFKE
jgi:hypothetical protein